MLKRTIWVVVIVFVVVSLVNFVVVGVWRYKSPEAKHQRTLAEISSLDSEELSKKGAEVVRELSLVKSQIETAKEDLGNFDAYLSRRVKHPTDPNRTLSLLDLFKDVNSVSQVQQLSNYKTIIAQSLADREKIRNKLAGLERQKARLSELDKEYTGALNAYVQRWASTVGPQLTGGVIVPPAPVSIVGLSEGLSVKWYYLVPVVILGLGLIAIGVVWIVRASQGFYRLPSPMSRRQKIFFGLKLACAILIILSSLGVCLVILL